MPVIPSTRSVFVRHVNALRRLAVRARLSPRKICVAALLEWQGLAFPLLPQTQDLLNEISQMRPKPEVVVFVDWLRQQSLNDSAYWLSSAYAALVSDEKRNSQAMFFTPPVLAERMIDQILAAGASLDNGVWQDPACGGGAFLLPVAQRMVKAMEKRLSSRELLLHIQANLRGTDIDDVLRVLSEEFIRMALVEHIATAGISLSFNVRQASGLQRFPEWSSPDVVICNPPYRKLTSKEVERLKSQFSTVMEGQTNLYALFMYEAVEIVRNGGVVGMLTPTSFLSGHDFKKLRAQLLSVAEITHLDFLSNRRSVFINVDQEAAITVFHCRPQLGHRRGTRISVLGQKGNFGYVGTCVLPADGSPWSAPRRSEHLLVTEAARHAQGRLADFGFHARVGPLVGYRDARRRYLRKPKAIKNFVPLVWATDISPLGIFQHQRPTKLKSRAPYVHARADDPWVINTPSVLLQRLTSNDQSHRLVAVAVPESWIRANGGFIAENHVIVLQQVEDRGWSPEQLAAILNSEPVDAVFRAVSGANNVSIYELKNLPLPIPSLLRQQMSVKKLSLDVALNEAYLACSPAIRAVA